MDEGPSMRTGHEQGSETSAESGGSGGAGASPGKRTRTEAVQRKASSEGAERSAPPDDPVASSGPMADPFDFGFASATGSSPRVVQMRSNGGSPEDPAQVSAISESGLGSGGSLPHQAALESGFGVDLSD